MPASDRKYFPRCMVCKKPIDISTPYWGRVNTIGEQKYWHDSCNALYEAEYSMKSP